MEVNRRGLKEIYPKFPWSSTCQNTKGNTFEIGTTKINVKNINMKLVVWNSFLTYNLLINGTAN